MSQSLRGKTVLASGFDAPARGEIRRFEQLLIILDDAGVIQETHAEGSARYEQLLSHARQAGDLVAQPAGTYLLPGFVDLHIHAPQYPQLGSALDQPLDVWLKTYTFPLEAKYRDEAFAERAYGILIEDLIASGTTTALYFGTIHPAANRILADKCLEKGQRALIGKVAMDHKELCPPEYRDASVDEALAGTQDLIDYITRHPDNSENRVKPVVTPRFIPACTDELLGELGQLAGAHNCHIQTHASEGDWEHNHVLDRHGMSDTESLDRFGLLREHTVLAHGNFLSLVDMERIKTRKAAVAHCPLSNAYFADAIFPLAVALEKGVRVGLGTDISAGPSSSLANSLRSSLWSGRLLESGTDPAMAPGERSSRAGQRIGMHTAFHLATAGGAEALGLPVGSFQPGMIFDAILVDPEAKAAPIRLWQDLYGGDEILEKLLYGVTRANIAQVWIGAELCAGEAV
ncbi:guanine deaminase [Roseibium sp. CAU 1637]|uniref:Guanine deaminase n=1 Tax=Roseibium limicola TaxID=2816037 RepID=A0A939EKL9_9HYPH|nr:guanine deaminase [Roseibium limicola]MBO0344203.1 guanine deaminase [Roseibium limicola]